MKLLRIVRSVFAIPQGELAKYADIGVRELNRIEKGEVAPSKATLAAIDKALSVIVTARAKEESRE